MVESVVERDEFGGDEGVGGVTGGDCNGVELKKRFNGCDAFRERDEFAMINFQQRYYAHHHSLRLLTLHLTCLHVFFYVT